MYNFDMAKEYWEDRISCGNCSINNVLSLGEKELINVYYDIWEKRIIGNFIGDVSNKEVLDVPCGSGRWTIDLAKKAKEVTAVDLSEKILRLVRKRANVENLNNIAYYENDIQEINQLNSKYDIILCTGLYEHLPESIYTELTANLAGLLRQRGKIIIVINNENNNYLYDRRDNKYRKGYQLENGYICGVTRGKKVIDKLVENNINVVNYAINSIFSCVRKQMKNSNDTDLLCKCLDSAIELDCKMFANLSDYKSVVADQIIIMGEKDE